MAFCGDGVCEERETAENCPMDCCYKVNSACTLHTGDCIPECCGEPTCCLGGTVNGTIPGLNFNSTEPEVSSGMNAHVVLSHIFATIMFTFFLVL